MKKSLIVHTTGADFAVKVIDPTHVTLTMVCGTTNIDWAYHVGQLSRDVVEQLQAMGVMDSRHYVKMEE